MSVHLRACPSLRVIRLTFLFISPSRYMGKMMPRCKSPTLRAYLFKYPCRLCAYDPIQEAAIIPAMALLTAPIARQSQIVVHWKCGPRHGQGHSHGRGCGRPAAGAPTIKIQLVDSDDDDDDDDGDDPLAAVAAAAISDLSCKRIIQSAAAAAANKGAKVGRPARPTE